MIHVFASDRNFLQQVIDSVSDFSFTLGIVSVQIAMMLVQDPLVNRFLLTRSIACRATVAKPTILRHCRVCPTHPLERDPERADVLDGVKQFRLSRVGSMLLFW